MCMFYTVVILLGVECSDGNCQKQLHEMHPQKQEYIVSSMKEDSPRTLRKNLLEKDNESN